MNLWEVLVRPILEYAAEVWGGGGWEAAEKLQREVGKLILGARAERFLYSRYGSILSLDLIVL